MILQTLKKSFHLHQPLVKVELFLNKAAQNHFKAHKCPWGHTLDSPVLVDA